MVKNGEKTQSGPSGKEFRKQFWERSLTRNKKDARKATEPSADEWVKEKAENDLTYTPFKTKVTSRDSQVRGTTPQPTDDIDGQQEDINDTRRRSYSAAGRKLSETSSLMYQSIMNVPIMEQPPVHMWDGGAAGPGYNTGPMMANGNQQRIVLAGGPDDPLMMHHHHQASLHMQQQQRVPSRAGSDMVIGTTRFHQRYHHQPGGGGGTLHRPEPVRFGSSGHLPNVDMTPDPTNARRIGTIQQQHYPMSLEHLRQTELLSGGGAVVHTGKPGKGSKEKLLERELKRAAQENDSADGGSSGGGKHSAFHVNWSVTMKLSCLLIVVGVLLFALGGVRLWWLRARWGLGVEALHGAFVLFTGVVGCVAAARRHTCALVAAHCMAVVACLLALPTFLFGMAFTLPKAFDNLPSYWFALENEPEGVNIALSVLCIIQVLLSISLTITGCQTAGRVIETAETTKNIIGPQRIQVSHHGSERQSLNRQMIADAESIKIAAGSLKNIDKY